MSLPNTIPPLPGGRLTRLQSSTVHWQGSDQQHTWERNIKIPANKEYFTEHGWDTLTSITYTYNSHAFRDEEFDNRACHIALGCSFTEGIGLNAKQVWPTKLTRLLNKYVWNLGAGGCALDTCYRLAEYYVPLLQPEVVFLLTPPKCRFELFYNNQVECYLPLHNGNNVLFKTWAIDENNAIINQQKNITAIKYICEKYNSRLIIKESDSDMIDTELARDLMHHGEPTHDDITNQFLREFNNG